MYYLCLLKYNDLLKDYYKKTYLYIDNNKKENLNFLKKELKKNYLNIKNCSQTSIKQKIIKFIICKFPLAYTRLFNR